VSMGFGVLSTHRHRLRWDRTAASELVRFGKWIFVSTALTFLSQSGDKLALPHVLTIKDLSFYALATGLILIPTSIFKQLASRIMFPAYSQMLHRGDKDRVKRATNRFLISSMPLFAVPVVFLFASNPIIGVMYDSRYAPTGYALSILAIGGYFVMLRATQGGLLLAAGKSKYATITQLARIAIGLPLGIFLAREWGLEGFCAGISTAEGFALLVQRNLTRRTIPELPAMPDVLLTLALFVAVSIKVVIV